MSGKVKFTCVGLEMTGTLNDSKTAAEVLAHLPTEELAQTAAGYVFFSMPLALEEEDSHQSAPPEDGQELDVLPLQDGGQVSAGAIAYWPAGSAICVFFGGQPPTPVNVIGSLNGNALAWRNVLSGTPVKMDKA